jgi:hypothetical protein
MRQNSPDIATFIVHPGTGTVIDADEAVVVNIDTTSLYHEDDVINEAVDQHNTLYSMYVVMVGNIFDGFRTVGPFINVEEAIQWGDQFAETDWYTSRIMMPWGEAR